MQHPVVDEEAKQEFPTLEVGEAHFHVVKAEETISKSGNAMVKLTAKVIDGKKQEAVIIDYLVALESMAFKIKHFWESVGSPDQYATGDSPVELMLNKRGKCLLKLDKPKDPQYSARVVIADYLPVGDNDIIDDDLPF